MLKNKIIILIEGGNIHQIYSNHVFEFVIVDKDNDAINDDPLTISEPAPPHVIFETDLTINHLFDNEITQVAIEQKHPWLGEH